MGIKSLSAAVQHTALRSASLGGPSTSFRLLVSVQDGVHRGAAFIAESSQSVHLGASPDCDLVLLDDGIHGKPLRFYEQDGRLVADVLAPGVYAAGVELPTGIKIFDEPAARLRLGGAKVQVELLRRTRRRSASASASVDSAVRSRAASRQSRNWATLTLGGLSIATALAVVGGAVNATAHRNAQQEVRTLNNVIEFFNSHGAQMVVSIEPGGTSRVQGLVADAPMRGLLERDIRAAGLKADLQVFDVRQMGESLTRLALLMGKSCEARHLGGARFECDAGVAGKEVVSQLSALAQQVPGVVALEVRALEPELALQLPLLAKASLAEPASSTAPAPMVAFNKLPTIRHVAIGAGSSFAYDASGRRLQVGDSVDGASVVSIRFDGVEFARDKQRYHVAVAPMLTSASGSATDSASSSLRPK